MYLAKYFFPFGFTILESAIYLLTNKNMYTNQKQNKNLS
jgi:RsiW-degrading membrane proteinase PrsW (M82 family)